MLERKVIRDEYNSRATKDRHLLMEGFLQKHTCPSNKKPNHGDQLVSPPRTIHEFFISDEPETFRVHKSVSI